MAVPDSDPQRGAAAAVDGAKDHANRAASVDDDFLALLACPRCPTRPPLRRGDDGVSLVCGVCGRVYPFTDGFPDLRLTEEELAATAPAARENGGGSTAESATPTGAG